MSKFNTLLLIITFTVFAGFGLYQWLPRGPGTQTTKASPLTPAQARKRYFHKQQKQSHLPVAQKSIAFRLPDLSGKERSLGEWKGQLILLNFWAPWCGPCRREIPLLKSMQSQYGSRGFQIIGLGEDQPAKVRAYAKKADFNYPVLLGVDQISGMGKAYGNNPEVLPFSVLIAANGKILKRHRGSLSRSLLQKWIAQRLPASRRAAAGNTTE